MKMCKFKICKIIFLTFILYLVFFTSTLHYKHQIEIYIVNDDKQQQIKNFQLEDKFFDNHPTLKPTESLRKNFAVGSDLCGKKHFHAAFEHEYCTWEYIKTKSINDYKILENIRYYCLDITDNECDRRNCIEKIIYD